MQAGTKNRKTLGYISQSSSKSLILTRQELTLNILS